MYTEIRIKLICQGLLGWPLLLLFLVFFENAEAQTTHQQAYWLRVYARGKLQEKWSWHLELDERRLIRPDRQLQFIAHAHLHWRVGARTEVSLGGSHSIVNELPEWRLFQELHYVVPIGGQLRLANRFRTEQRWLSQVEGDWRLRFRLRFRLQLDYKIGAKWVAKISDEIMWHKEAFDQNRTYVAFERGLSKVLSWELGYLKIFQRRTESTCFERDILRSTFYLNF